MKSKPNKLHQINEKICICQKSGETLEYLMEQEWFSYRPRNGYFEAKGVTRKVILKLKTLMFKHIEKFSDRSSDRFSLFRKDKND